jgi:hypothetical protein
MHSRRSPDWEFASGFHLFLPERMSSSDEHFSHRERRVFWRLSQLKSTVPTQFDHLVRTKCCVLHRKRIMHILTSRLLPRTNFNVTGRSCPSPTNRPAQPRPACWLTTLIITFPRISDLLGPSLPSMTVAQVCDPHGAKLITAERSCVVQRPARDCSPDAVVGDAIASDIRIGKTALPLRNGMLVITCSV